MRIYGALRTLQESRGLSQRGLALSLGFSPGYVSDILRGRTKPSLEFLKRVSEEYDVTIDWLVTGKGPKLKEKGINRLMFRVSEELRQKLCKDPPSEDVAVIPILGKDTLAQLPRGNTIDTELYQATNYCILPRNGVKSPKTSFCFELIDNDMAPCLPQESCAVINTSIRAPTQLKGSLCALWSDDKLLVRRLRLTPKHLIFEPVVVSENNIPLCFEVNDNPIAGKVESAWCFYG